MPGCARISPVTTKKNATSRRNYQYDPMGNYLQRESASAYGNGYLVLDTATYDGYGIETADNFSNGVNAPRGESIGFGGQWGNYTDPETGLICLGHRYYDPGTGRFLNRDPIGYAGGENLYGYCGNNPINRADPEGTDGFGSMVNFTIGLTDDINPVKICGELY